MLAEFVFTSSTLTDPTVICVHLPATFDIILKTLYSTVIILESDLWDCDCEPLTLL